MSKILVVDIETTGFSTSKDVMVEIGIVSLDLDNGEIKTLYDKVVRDKRFNLEYYVEREKHGWVFENSDLTPQMVFDATPLGGEIPIIQEILNSFPNGATAFNRSFDFRYFEANNLVAPRLLDCPMLLTTNICCIPDKNGKNKRPSVEEAYKYFFPKSNYIEKHRGADDALHEAQIVYELHKLGVFKLDKQ